MTKAEIIARVATEAKITKTQAEKAVNAVTGTITKDLKKGGRITLTGARATVCQSWTPSFFSYRSSIRQEGESQVPIPSFGRM